jgi:hypothetical protein
MPFIVGCPACQHDFLHFFCTITCSPDQATFTNVTELQIAPSNNATVVKTVGARRRRLFPAAHSAPPITGGAGLRRSYWLRGYRLLHQAPAPAAPPCTGSGAGALPRPAADASPRNPRLPCAGRPLGFGRLWRRLLRRLQGREVRRGQPAGHEVHRRRRGDAAGVSAGPRECACAPGKATRSRCRPTAGRHPPRYPPPPPLPLPPPSRSRPPTRSFFGFLGDVKDKRFPPIGSPFQINFHGQSTTPEGMAPLEGSMLGCGDPGFTCSCAGGRAGGRAGWGRRGWGRQRHPCTPPAAEPGSPGPAGLAPPACDVARGVDAPGGGRACLAERGPVAAGRAWQGLALAGSSPWCGPAGVPADWPALPLLLLPRRLPRRPGLRDARPWAGP